MQNEGLRFATIAFQLGFIDQKQLDLVRSQADDDASYGYKEVLDHGWISVDQANQIARKMSDAQSELESNQTVQSNPTNNSSTVAFDPSGIPIADRTLQESQLELGNATAGDDFEVKTEDSGEESKEWLEQIGYQAADLYAEGGLSKIWVVRDPNINRDVALKEIREELANHKIAKSRFRREAQVTGQLEHPNIVPVYQVSRSEDDDRLYYTMRLVQGQTLREAIDDYHYKDLTGRARNLEELKLLQAFIDVCQAIAYANSRGVIHRDIKPDNVVLGSFGEVIVLDWGLAKTVDAADSGSADGNIEPDKAESFDLQPKSDRRTLDDSESFELEAQQFNFEDVRLPRNEDEFQTVAGSVLGTPAYMAPEQVDSSLGAVNQLTDVWGLGATLYRLLTGQAPRMITDLKADVPKIPTSRIPPAKSINPKAPRALNAICSKAMAHDQEDRYLSALDLANDVQRYIADEPVTAHKEPVWMTARRWISNHRTGVAAAVALLVAVSAASLIANVLLNREKAATEVARNDAEMLASEMTYNRGLLLCKQGDIGSGVLWFARCLENLPPEATDLERVLRMSIASWQAKLNPMDRIIASHPNLVAVHHSKTKPWILIASSEGWVEIRNTTNGRLVNQRVETGSPLLDANFAQGPNQFFTIDSDSAVSVWGYDGIKIAGPFAADARVDVVVANRRANRLFAGCENGQGYLWAINNGKLITDEINHQTQIMSAEFSQTGNYLCVGDASNIARIYNPKNGSAMCEDLQHDGWVMNVRFSPTGSWLASSTNNNQAYIWNVRRCLDLDGPSLRPGGRFQQGRPGINARPNAGQGPRNRRPIESSTPESNATNDAPSADIETLKPDHTIGHQGDIRFIAFNKSGTTLMSGASDNTVRLWRVKNGREICPPLDHVGVPTNAYFYKNGTRVVTGSTDNIIRFWNAINGKPVGSTITLGSALRSFGINPSGNQLVTLEQNGRITAWSINPEKEELILRHAETVYDADFHPTKKVIATGTSGQADSIRLWNTENGKPMGDPIPNGGFTFALAFDKSGKNLLSGGTQSWLRFWNINSRKETREGLSGSSPLTAVAISNDSQFVARIGWDEILRVTKLKDRSTTELPVETGREVAFHPSSEKVASAGSNGTIQIWTVPPKPDPLMTIQIMDEIRDIEFSPDGSKIAAACRDRFVRVWDVETGEEVGSPMAHDGAVNSVAFDPTGQLLASGCDDGTARVWDLVERKQVAAPLRHDGSVLSVTFRDDGKQIATTSHDKTTRLWDVPEKIAMSSFELTKHLQKMSGNYIDEFNNTQSLTNIEIEDISLNQK